MMKRILLALAVAAIVPTLVGCSAPTKTVSAPAKAGSTASGAGQASEAAPSTEWKAMEMGPDAAKTLTLLPRGVQQFNDNQKRIGYKAVDVTGKKPLFGGYSVLVYAKSGATYDTVQISVIGGSIAGTLIPGSPLVKERVYISKGMPSLYPEPIDPPTADGKDAVAKALAFMKKEFPDREWKAGLWGHIFAYDMGGDHLVIAMQHDGNGSMAMGPAVK